jgi:hypothetical protein
VVLAAICVSVETLLFSHPSKCYVRRITLCTLVGVAGGAAQAAPPGTGRFQFSDRDPYRDPGPYPSRDDVRHYHRYHSQCSLPFPEPVVRRSREY